MPKELVRTIDQMNDHGLIYLEAVTAMARVIAGLRRSPGLWLLFLFGNDYECADHDQPVMSQPPDVFCSAIVRTPVVLIALPFCV